MVSCSRLHVLRSGIAPNSGVLGNDLLFLILCSYHSKLLVLKISTKEGGGLVKPHLYLRICKLMVAEEGETFSSVVAVHASNTHTHTQGKEEKDMKVRGTYDP